MQKPSVTERDLNTSISDVLEELQRITKGSMEAGESDLHHSAPDIEHILGTLEKSIADHETSEYIDTLADALVDVSWEECNVGHWSEVPENPKTVYSYGSLQKVLLCLIKAVSSPGKEAEFLKAAISSADLGLMLGKGFELPLTKAATLITSLLNQCTSDTEEEASNDTLEPSRNEPCGTSRKDQSEEFLKEGLNSCPVMKSMCPSIEEFSVKYFSPREPVLLSGCIDHWPALRRWKDLDYLMRIAGPRTVPVEIGSSYTQNDWGMELTSMHDFITKHILGKAPKVGYLAQHQLFDQIPELKRDIVTPDYCALSDSDDGDCDVSINAWFGPANTVTPLHHDPKHNLLCQVVGAKRILLFSPEDSAFLYPHDESMLNNTAKVDPYAPDYDKYPNFKSALARYCTLSAGEMLYIPPKWWHHVKSLDVSFSVSFWWE